MQEYYKGLTPAQLRNEMEELKKIEKAFEKDAEQKHRHRRDIPRALPINVTARQQAGSKCKQRRRTNALRIEVEHPMQKLLAQMPQ